MAPDRRRLAVLLAILAILVGIAAVRYWPSTDAGQAGQPNTAAARRAASAARVAAPDVHLRELNQEKPAPDTGRARDLFRFKLKPAPAPAVPLERPTPASQPSGPPPPPPIPQIALRFIGLVEAPAQSQRIAILSDGRAIYQGREGDTIEGRYRILRIGVESIDMAYVDGTGRQTIRLSGS